MELFLIINNYLHDMATGFFFAATLIAYVLARKMNGAGLKNVEQTITLLKRIALWSFIAIFPFGLIRLAFFNKIELKPYSQVDMTQALLVKHFILFILTFSGVYLWFRLSKEKR